MIPTLGAIIPAAVGVDIGCGMMAVRTQYRATICRPIGSVCTPRSARAIPLSAGKYNRDVERDGRSGSRNSSAGRQSIRPMRIAPNWRLQLGSLGSGNHFIEVSLDEEGRVWLFLHSGSRGVGNKLAPKHIKVAQQQCQRRWITLPDPDLAYLVRASRSSGRTSEALRWAQRFAYLNREEMMDRVVDAFAAGSAARSSERVDQLPPQLHRAGEAFRQGGMAVPQGCDRRRAPACPA